jgi:hypothetical protein
MDIVSYVFDFVVQYKWWLIACCPVVLAIIILKMMNPR